MKSKRTKLVMVFGTFDYLHAGHENLFTQAKEHGTHVVAILARDRTVKTIKGQLPDHNEKLRLKSLETTGWADKVILGNQKDKTRVIRELRPEVIALGYDQFAFTYGLEKYLIDIKLDAKIVRLKPYRPDMYKSSIVKRQLCYNQEHETQPSI
jgi:FAD synthetase